MPNLTPSDINTPCPPRIAGERARLMLSCYRQGEASDPEAYVTAICAVLTYYPEPVVRKVTHPLHGIPGKLKWLPSIAEVKAACDAEVEPIRAQQAAEERIRRTNAMLRENSAELPENRERAVRRWFEKIRPSMLPVANQRATKEEATQSLLKMSGMSPSDFDALPDAPERPTFEKLKGKTP